MAVAEQALSYLPEAAPDSAAIPIMRPRLPQLAALEPYLRQIDRNRWYSNFGPLLMRFEAALADHFGVAPDNIVCVTNGTEAMILALRAQAAPGTLCMMPAWTFAASAAAAVAAGLTPWFVDVAPESWALDPAAARQFLAHAPGRVGAVLPVGVFGAPADVEAWDAFREETGIPVVIDAASGFDSARCGTVPTMVSLHATKVFGVGEGGLILSHDRALIGWIRRFSNFGFLPGRVVNLPGVNAKLSEYAAAIGLASFDEWSATRAGYVQTTTLYEQALSAIPGITPAPGFASGFITATLNVAFERPIADEAAKVFAENGIEYRQWWAKGCHRQPAFIGCPRVPLPVSEALAERVIGLPFFPGITAEDVAHVADALGRATRRDA